MGRTDNKNINVKVKILSEYSSEYAAWKKASYVYVTYQSEEEQLADITETNSITN
jgi:hypothetical protein